MMGEAKTCPTIVKNVKKAELKNHLMMLVNTFVDWYLGKRKRFDTMGLLKSVLFVRLFYSPSLPYQSDPFRPAHVCPYMLRLAQTKPHPSLDLYAYPQPPTSHIAHPCPISQTHADLPIFAHSCPYLPKLAHTHP